MFNIKLISFALLFLLAWPALLMADTSGNDVSGMGVIFNGVILLLVIVCFVFALRIFSLLRGGEMASGWQFLAISFIVICLGQLVELFSTLELFAINHAVVMAIRLAGIFLLVLGIAKIKKVLS